MIPLNVVRAALQDALRVVSVRLAIVVWCSVALGMQGMWIASVGAVLLVLGALMAPTQRTLLLIGVVAIAAGVAAGYRSDAAMVVVPGPITVTGVVMANATPTATVVQAHGVTSRLGDGAVVSVETDDFVELDAGSPVTVRGQLRRLDTYVGRFHTQALLRDAEIEVHRQRNPIVSAGNAIRRSMLETLGATSEPRRLLRGFLVGDTSGLTDMTIDNLRKSGLSHYVAVSGSNVALVLVGWWIVGSLLGVPLRFRVLAAFVVLALFVVVTRWEPSVVRAAAMATVALLAKLFDIPVTGWQAIGLSVAALLLASPELTGQVGFQLSVAATIGVMVAARVLAVSPGNRIRSLVVTTAAAQIAVAPLVLWHFSSVPLMAPIANVVAAPLVVAATVLGGIGTVAQVGPLLGAADAAASCVLLIALVFGGLPQLGAVPLGCATAALLAWVRLSWSRLPIAVGGTAIVAIVAMPAPSITGPELIMLDVGQGDAILVRDHLGSVILVDGGEDPEVLDAALARHGVDDIDLIVVTHGDADHAAGLVGLAADRHVARLGFAGHRDPDDAVVELQREVTQHGGSLIDLVAGDRIEIGAIVIDVLSPQRRFASDNDGSVALWVEAGGPTVMLTADLESIAQAELPPLQPDILQVPHHGSSTTDLQWLKRTVGSVALISVGPNAHGHPTAEVLETLAATATRVLMTLHDGDVIVPIGPDLVSSPP